MKKPPAQKAEQKRRQTAKATIRDYAVILGFLSVLLFRIATLKHAITWPYLAVLGGGCVVVIALVYLLSLTIWDWKNNTKQKPPRV